MVHQHFMLVPVFDVVEAVALGAETVTGSARHVRPQGRAPARRRALGAIQAQRRSRREDRGPPRRRAPAGRDPQGALPAERHPRPRRADRGAHAVRDRGAVRRSSAALAAAGTTIIFITHKLNEVLEVADKHHRPAARPGRRDGRPQDGDPRAAREPDGRSRRGAHRPQGPGPAGRGRAAARATCTSATTAGDMAVNGRRPRGPRRRDRRHRRRPGQRPDRARRGHRRASGRRLRRRSRSPASTARRP